MAIEQSPATGSEAPHAASGRTRALRRAAAAAIALTAGTGLLVTAPSPDTDAQVLSTTTTSTSTTSTTSSTTSTTSSTTSTTAGTTTTTTTIPISVPAGFLPPQQPINITVRFTNTPAGTSGYRMEVECLNVPGTDSGQLTVILTYPREGGTGPAFVPAWSGLRCAFRLTVLGFGQRALFATQVLSGTNPPNVAVAYSQPNVVNGVAVEPGTVVQTAPIFIPTALNVVFGDVASNPVQLSASTSTSTTTSTTTTIRPSTTSTTSSTLVPTTLRPITTLPPLTVATLPTVPPTPPLAVATTNPPTTTRRVTVTTRRAPVRTVLRTRLVCVKRTNGKCVRTVRRTVRVSVR
jgi:hypothetical protein